MRIAKASHVTYTLMDGIIEEMNISFLRELSLIVQSLSHQG